MKIEPGCAVTIAFDLCDEKGEIIEASDITGAVSFIHGRGAIIPGLDRRLVGMSAGDEGNFTFPPEEAFGSGHDGPVKLIPRKEFPAEATIEKGTVFEAGVPGGQRINLVVDQVAGDQVTVRLLHPLAGQTISMSVKVLAVRQATPAELETGKVISRPPPPPKN